MDFMIQGTLEAFDAADFRQKLLWRFPAAEDVQLNIQAGSISVAATLVMRDASAANDVQDILESTSVFQLSAELGATIESVSNPIVATRLLKLPPLPLAPPSPSPPSADSSLVLIVVGVIVGAAMAFLLIVMAYLLSKRRRQRSEKQRRAAAAVHAINEEPPTAKEIPVPPSPGLGRRHDIILNPTPAAAAALAATVTTTAKGRPGDDERSASVARTISVGSRAASLVPSLMLSAASSRSDYSDSWCDSIKRTGKDHYGKAKAGRARFGTVVSPRSTRSPPLTATMRSGGRSGRQSGGRSGRVQIREPAFGRSEDQDAERYRRYWSKQDQAASSRRSIGSANTNRSAARHSTPHASPHKRSAEMSASRYSSRDASPHGRRSDGRHSSAHRSPHVLHPSHREARRREESSRGQVGSSKCTSPLPRHHAAAFSSARREDREQDGPSFATREGAGKVCSRRSHLLASISTPTPAHRRRGDRPTQHESHKSFSGGGRRHHVALAEVALAEAKKSGVLYDRPSRQRVAVVLMQSMHTDEDPQRTQTVVQLEEARQALKNAEEAVARLKNLPGFTPPKGAADTCSVLGQPPSDTEPTAKVAPWLTQPPSPTPPPPPSATRGLARDAAATAAGASIL